MPSSCECPVPLLTPDLEDDDLTCWRCGGSLEWSDPRIEGELTK